MRSPLPRVVLIALLLGSSGACAQPVPPTPPHPPVKRTPLITAAPGSPAHHPGPKPSGAKPAGHRPALVKPAPVPVPAVTAPPALPAPGKDAEPAKGSNTGSPLPRFAALRSDEVNLRTGPGTRYPIDWVYKRRDLPVMIEREFEVWRLIRDPEGVKGWVNQATLAPRRTGVVVGSEQPLRNDPKDDASAVARLKPGVIVRLRSCEATSDWCQAQVQDYRGWIKRTEIWGTFPGEAIQ